MDILPVELIPVILKYLQTPQDLSVTCRVNKVFWTFSTTLLYERIHIQAWHRQSKQKVIQLFSTLASSDLLPTYIRTLEVRDYPKGLNIDESARLTGSCVAALSRCKSLRSCVWTRDGSLSSPIIETLAACPKLEDLTINGHSGGHYSPHLLLKISILKRLTIIMPSASIISVLPSWTRTLGQTLRHFSLICKDSPLLTDRLLSHCCQNLSFLSSLHLTGCSKISHTGIISALKTNSSITSLGLAGLSPHFELSPVMKDCETYKLLQSLSSVTLTVPKESGSLDCWWDDLNSVLSHAPLQEFQLYTIGGDLIQRQLPETFASQLIKGHGLRLRKFAVQRLQVSLRIVGILCRECLRLERLFITLREKNLRMLGNCFQHSQTINTLHISFPPDATTDSEEGRLLLSKEELLCLVSYLGPQLRSIGVSTRVFLVERILDASDGEVDEVRTQLTPYRSPEIPEQFLVVQT